MWNYKKKKKRSNSYKQIVEKWLPGSGGWGKHGEVGKKVRTFTYQMNEVWGANVYHGDCDVRDALID